MHMPDALVSPAVGGFFWLVSGSAWIRSCLRLRRAAPPWDPRLAAGLGALVFAVQMLNFAIPGSGSSGHLVGGLFLAILLGPHAAFLTLAPVLVVQALLFADGGLLALGCNLFNMGFIPTFVVFPLLYRPLAESGRPGAAAVLGSGCALLLGAAAVALETHASGPLRLPLQAFLPLQLGIGLVEGGLSAGILHLVRTTRPAGLQGLGGGRYALALLGALALVLGSGLSWAASAAPDALESAVARATLESAVARATLESAVARAAPESAVAGAAPESAVARATLESAVARATPESAVARAAPESAVARAAPEGLAPAGPRRHPFERAQQATALLPDYQLPGHPRERAATALSGVLGGSLSCLLVLASACLAQGGPRGTRRKADPGPLSP